MRAEIVFFYIICLIAMTYMFINYKERGQVKTT
jgi:hypothetical protein